MCNLLKKNIFLFIFLFLANFIYSQNSETITDILNTEKVTNGQIAYLAGVYEGALIDDVSYKTAFETLKKQNLFNKNSKYSDYATMEQVALVFLKATNIKGGLLFRLTSSKRYAFKELKSKGIIPQNVSPKTTLSGYEVFGIFNSCISE